jgi:hypothetical protein
MITRETPVLIALIEKGVRIDQEEVGCMRSCPRKIPRSVGRRRGSLSNQPLY